MSRSVGACELEGIDEWWYQEDFEAWAALRDGATGSDAVSSVDATLSGGDSLWMGQSTEAYQLEGLDELWCQEGAQAEKALRAGAARTEAVSSNDEMGELALADCFGAGALPVYARLAALPDGLDEDIRGSLGHVYGPTVTEVMNEDWSQA